MKNPCRSGTTEGGSREAGHPCPNDEAARSLQSFRCAEEPDDCPRRFDAPSPLFRPFVDQVAHRPGDANVDRARPPVKGHQSRKVAPPTVSAWSRRAKVAGPNFKGIAAATVVATVAYLMLHGPPSGTPDQQETIVPSTSPMETVAGATDHFARSSLAARHRGIHPACLASVRSDALLWCRAALGARASQPIPPPDECVPDFGVRADTVRIAANAIVEDRRRVPATAVCRQAVEIAMTGPRAPMPPAKRLFLPPR